MPVKTSPKAKGKSKARANVDTGTDGENFFGLEVWGLILLSVALISVISLISEFVAVGEENLLGPYLGNWWAFHLNLFAGSLPVLLLISAVSILGFKLLQGRREMSLQLVFVFTLLFVMTSVLLSIGNIGKLELQPSDFQDSGGYLGNFLVRNCYVPVFGMSRFGPYFVSALAILLIIVWGFKITLARVVEQGTILMGTLVYPVFDGLARLKSRRAERQLQSGLALTASKGIHSPGEPKSRARKGKVTSLPAPLGLDSLSESDVESLVAVPTDSRIADSDDTYAEDDNDPFTVRKRRDLDLHRKRVSDLNDWELKKQNPEIAGMLQKEKLGKEEAAERRGYSLVPRKEDSKLEAASANDAEEQLERSYDDSAEAGEKREVKYDTYRIPALDEIFEEPPEQPLEFTEEELRTQSKALEDQLINFKVMGKVVQICPGPVITRYEVELAPGVKVNRISNLSDDLGLALKAKSIRILAPIPGKSLVGIEVPNRKAQIVYIKEILQSDLFDSEGDTLKICLGKTIAGDPYVMDLTRAPHLLIAGQTGSGKSVCINSIMASFLCSRTPDELRMLLIDPKVVELKPYDSIPHLLYPVITQPETAVQALKWATFEMDRRYEVLALSGVRNIKGFNMKFREGKLDEKLEPEDNLLMPYIVIIIDELADLMMVAGKEVETNIARIAQKARAVGIHLILATQRPSTNVITGTIKANLPTRISFQVASQIDARTIMDRMGAEKLLGRGDMLFRPIEFPEPMRLHGCFLDDEQAEKIAEVCSGQFVNYPQLPGFNLDEDLAGAGVNDEPRDEKFRDAAELVVSLKQASVSLLQRRLGIGYARSGRLVDQLERAGIVGRERGSKPREVLMDEDELTSFLSSGLNDD